MASYIVHIVQEAAGYWYLGVRRGAKCLRAPECGAAYTSHGAALQAAERVIEQDETRWTHEHKSN
jgi:hypothetical protein